MKNMYAVIGIVGVLVVGGLGVIFLSGGSDMNDNQNSETSSVSEQQNNAASTQPSIEDEELMRFVEKDSVEYKNAISFQGEEYDQYFIANMIHYSEGISQLESLAVGSSNPAIAEGASERSKQAEEDAVMYRKLQKDMGQPISYGNAMQYHAAMGADAEVYFSTSSLEGLAGAEFESKIVEQLKYFRRAETLLSGAGINNAVDQQVKKLVNETLTINAVILDRM